MDEAQEDYQQSLALDGSYKTAGIRLQRLVRTLGISPGPRQPGSEGNVG
ncbi:MAG: hypothetical protein ACKOPS_23735 [Cyanobium sp.]